MKDCLALYLRLSQDDVDVKTNALKDESDSIHNQRLFLKRYIDSQADLCRFPVLEFADDGYSGTNFDRPQLQEMLSLVRSGRISCIIVKDLSRFGRNYLEVGDYLEHIFPFLNVRFIAVNDHYDSSRYIGTTGGIDVAFRNLVYQRYSHDLSEKVKSAMHMKMAEGKYINHCPYGYMKKPGVKHEMIPDPVTAPIVREIFLSAVSGMKSTEIAAMLNDKAVPTPMVYKNLSRKDLHNDAMWSHQAVIRIIKDYKYTGAMVNFKCENETVRASAQRKRKPEEWVVVENQHPPIVSHKEYEAANATLRKVRYKGFRASNRKDCVYYCAHCGRRLRKSYGRDEYYSCATKMYRPASRCSEIHWSRTEIEKVVLAAYKAHLVLMNDAYEKIQARVNGNPVASCRNKQKSVLSELEACKAENLLLYEKYRDGVFGKDAFMEKKKQNLQRKDQLERRLSELQEEEEEAVRLQSELEEQSQVLHESQSLMLFSDEELRTLMYGAIEKVVVYGNEEIEIQWKFHTPFQKGRGLIREAK